MRLEKAFIIVEEILKSNMNYEYRQKSVQNISSYCAIHNEISASTVYSNCMECLNADVEYEMYTRHRILPLL